MFTNRLLRRRAGLTICTLIAALVVGDFTLAGLAGLERVAMNLGPAIYATHPPGDSSRLFIVERGSPVEGDAGNSTAHIRILDLDTGSVGSIPFLSITGLNVGGEGGLLGMAFHPDYESNGKFYVYLTANDDEEGTPFSSYVREYTRSNDPNIANPDFTPILNFTQPQSNHNGGWIGFSPNDDYLYIMTGDGGNGNDQGPGHTEPGGNAQDITSNWLGKALRIDVNRDDFLEDDERNYGIPYDTIESPGNPFAPDESGGTDPEGDNEIWAYGLRNPFRAGFDRLTGDLWIGDVGQGSREEIDFQSADSTGGENYGWRLREGLIQNPSSVGGPSPAGAIDPIWDYNRIGDPSADPDFTGNTVIGGLVYRGPDPDLQGLYFFTDTASNQIWTLRPPTDTEPVEVKNVSSILTPDVGSPQTPVAFGEDAVGNLYVVYLSGSVYRIVTEDLVAGDYDGDGVVGPADYELWKADFGSVTNLSADGNGDGVIDAADYTVWRDNMGSNAPGIGVGSDARGSTVPEPATAPSVILLLGVLALVWRHGRNK